MAEIRAIETVYNGYRFRSRLEARWAVFFDTIGAKWEYEPEGFELKDGTYYLPDFLLHDVQGRGSFDDTFDIYIEIKGKMADSDLHKIKLFPLPIVVFGQIPDARWRDYIAFDGKRYRYWEFDFSKDNNDDFYNLEFSEGDYYWTQPKARKGGGLVLDYPDDPYDFVDDDLTEKGFTKAKQARFEHGECGA